MGVKASSVTENETTALMNGLQIGERSVKNAKGRNWRHIGIIPSASYLMALWHGSCISDTTGINDGEGVCRLFTVTVENFYLKCSESYLLHIKFFLLIDC